ncbi:uncharacterized protein LOC142980873 [Anticarsia gemmatalis]|uniref:uncharacterized protein LOC142980873 n=1 Tax=Anticarsia gemmatalis TaxID=129554 RepID=UPI003F774E49
MGDGQLIELVKQYEPIYNTKCDEYRDVTLRNSAWEEVAKSHGKTVNECKEDWNKLRNCYNNALKRRRNKSKIMAPWRFERQMSFLKPFLQGGSFSSDLEEDSYENIPSPKCILLPEAMESPESDRSTTPPPSSNISYKRKAVPEGDFTHFANMMNLMSSPNISQRNDELDEIDYFFLSMSKMVKRLPRLDQIRIKMDLHEAVSKAELKQLEAQQSTEDYK